jgi:Circularly permutated YpsA SLOG family
MALQKIVSGGQTGVDRGALDAALELGFPCGGWCPEGRKAEDGIIDARYPVTALQGAKYRERTIQNIIDSDGTVVLYFDYLQGGTEQTVVHSIRRRRPYKIVDGAVLSAKHGASLAAEFVARHDICVLNVAGPRQSKEPRAYAYAYALISELLMPLGGTRRGCV